MDISALRVTASPWPDKGCAAADTGAKGGAPVAEMLGGWTEGTDTHPNPHPDQLQQLRQSEHIHPDRL